MDVFDEGICDDVISEDWAKVERLRRTNGYREGLAAGQESTLQEGFNEGFSQGTQATFTVSFIKGIVNALITGLSVMDQGTDETEIKDSVRELQAILSELDHLRLQEDYGKGAVASSRPDTVTATDAKLAARHQGADSKDREGIPSEGQTGTCRCGNTTCGDSTSSHKTAPSTTSQSQGDHSGKACTESGTCSCQSAGSSSDNLSQGATDTSQCCDDLADLTLSPATASSTTTTTTEQTKCSPQPSASKDAASEGAIGSHTENPKTTDEDSCHGDSKVATVEGGCRGDSVKEHPSRAQDPALQSILSRLERHLSRLRCKEVVAKASHPFLRL